MMSCDEFCTSNRIDCKKEIRRFVMKAFICGSTIIYHHYISTVETEKLDAEDEQLIRMCKMLEKDESKAYKIRSYYEDVQGDMSMDVLERILNLATGA